MFIPEPRLFFCVGKEEGKNAAGQIMKWRLLFQPVIAQPHENAAPTVIITSQESLAAGVKTGKSYYLWDTDEGNRVTKRHIEPGDKPLYAHPTRMEKTAP